MTTEEKLTLFRERFVHRDDVWARQWYDTRNGKSGYVRVTVGHCPNNPPCPKRSCPHIMNVPISDDVLRGHLRQSHTIASYQLSEDNTVRWVCFDVDMMKATPTKPLIASKDVLQERVRAHTIDLAKKLGQLFGPGHVLVEFSGNKGYHLWLFFVAPVQARHAYALVRWLDVTIPPPDGIHVDLYPRQTDTRGYGNMVKLPLSRHQVTKEPCLFVDSSFNPYQDQWAALSKVAPLTEDALHVLIKEHKLDVPLSIRTDTQGKALFPCMTRMMAEGLGEGQRDIGMHKIASHMRINGLSEDMAQAALEVMNARNNPPIDDVQSKIESAYSNDYTSFPCGESLLDMFCSSSCRYWENKVQTRWVRYGKDPAEAVGVISRD